MGPEIGQAGFRIGLFLVLVAGGMLFLLEPGTPELSITVVTLVIGLVFVGVVVVLVRWFGR
ncbi:MAG: hypothetical protein M3Q65_01615 [Chloroflexota bacterium]|nr:hypothetical protein [Chloroflexota bacterium]